MEAIQIKKYFYVKVIEAREVVQKGLYYTTEPFVTVKKNGHEFKHKKSTSYAVGKEWWDVIFKFSTKHIDRDWIAVEVREKGWHVVSSDWIGEVQVRVRDFADGKVHQKWFKLGLGAWKHHTRRPRGYVQLAFQLKNSALDHPFESEPVEKVLSFADWIDRRPKGDPYVQKEVEDQAKSIEDKDREAKEAEKRKERRREKKQMQRERKRSTPNLGKKPVGSNRSTPVGTPKSKAAMTKTAVKDLKAPPQNLQVGQLINLIDWDSPKSVAERERRAKKSYNPFINSPSPVARTEASNETSKPKEAAQPAQVKPNLSSSAYPEFFHNDAGGNKLSQSAPTNAEPGQPTNPFIKSSSFDRLHAVEYNPFRLSETS